MIPQIWQAFIPSVGAKIAVRAAGLPRSIGFPVRTPVTLSPPPSASPTTPNDQIRAPNYKRGVLSIATTSSPTKYHKHPIPPLHVNQHSKMADTTTRPPLYQQTITLTLDILNGRHFLSKLIPPALLLLDTLLCAAVIWKVPCMSPPLPTHPPH